MTKNSALKFSQTLQEKAKQDSELIQKLQQEQLKKLAESLSDTLKAGLATMQQDTQKAAQSLQDSLKQQHQQMQSLQQEQAESLKKSQERLTQQLNKSVKASQRALRWGWLR